MIKRLKSLSISIKLMSTMTGLLVLTVGLYTLMNAWELNELHTHSLDEQQTISLHAVATNAVNLSQTLAYTGALLIKREQLKDLKSLAQEIRRMNPHLLSLRLYSGEHLLVEEGKTQNLKELSPLLKRAWPGGVMIFRRGEQLELLHALSQYKQGKSNCRVELDWSIRELNARRQRSAGALKNRKERSVQNILFLGGMLLLLAAVIMALQSLGISQPIRTLSHHVECIARGELEEQIQVEGGAEISLLGRNISHMVERLKVLFEETKEKTNYEHEMEVARLIQDALLPPQGLIDLGFFRFMGFFQSASICGGDWWSFADLSRGRLLILIGDVTGHGVSSAMITAAAKSCCDTLRHVSQGELSCSLLLEELNKTLYGMARREFLMSFFATIIDPEEHSLSFSNAGHNFPLLLRAQPRPGERALQPLVARGNRLGDLLGSRFQEHKIFYAPGDLLLWYTDGLTESLNAEGEQYGERRLRRSVQQALHSPVPEIMQRILEDAEQFCEDFKHPEDDVTLVLGKFSG